MVAKKLKKVLGNYFSVTFWRQYWLIW